MFFAMQKTDFHLFKLFSLIAQNHFFIASKSTNSVFSANDEIAGHGCSKTSVSVRKS